MIEVRTLRRIAVAAMVGALATTPAWAAKRSCAAGTTRVKGYGCVKNTEIEKAKRICAPLTPSDFRHCLCEDAKVVGACGD